MLSHSESPTADKKAISEMAFLPTTSKCPKIIHQEHGKAQTGRSTGDSLCYPKAKPTWAGFASEFMLFFLFWFGFFTSFSANLIYFLFEANPKI